MGTIISYPFGAGTTLTRVLEAGAGDRHVVMIHGLGARADRWSLNFDSLAGAGYHCHALDLPGHGYAQKNADYPYGVPAFAAFVRDYMDSAKIERAAVVGTSLGGHVSGYFAVHSPDRVRALALVGSVGLAPLGRAAAENVRANVKNTSREGIVGKLKFVMARQHLINDALIDEEFRINNSPGAARAFDVLGDYIVESIDRDAIGDKIKAFAAATPTILIWGAEDRAVPLKVGESARDRSGAELVVMPGCGHCSYMEDPARFNEILLGFLKKAGV